MNVRRVDEDPRANDVTDVGTHHEPVTVKLATGSSSNSYCGLGFNVCGDSKTGAIFVCEVLKNGPAKLCGKIHPGKCDDVMCETCLGNVTIRVPTQFYKHHRGSTVCVCQAMFMIIIIMRVLFQGIISIISRCFEYSSIQKVDRRKSTFPHKQFPYLNMW